MVLGLLGCLSAKVNLLQQREQLFEEEDCSCEGYADFVTDHSGERVGALSLDFSLDFLYLRQLLLDFYGAIAHVDHKHGLTDVELLLDLDCDEFARLCFVCRLGLLLLASHFSRMIRLLCKFKHFFLAFGAVAARALVYDVEDGHGREQGADLLRHVLEVC